jgi:hypothetical protein
MGIKRVFINVVLSFLLFAVAQAQEIKQDSINGNVENLNGQDVALQSLTDAKTVKDEASTNKVWKGRARYLNFFYGKQTLKSNTAELNSDMALALSFGRTFYLHKKPLAGIMKFGLDWSFLDLNFAKYPDLPESEGANNITVSQLVDLGIMQLEAGMGLGPSLTINPVNKLKLSLYFHVTPSYSVIIQDSEAYYHYATFFNVGLSVAYKVISIGVETRWAGATNYDGVALKRLDDVYDAEGNFHDPFESFAMDMKTNTVRVFVGLRF